MIVSREPYAAYRDQGLIDASRIRGRISPLNHDSLTRLLFLAVAVVLVALILFPILARAGGLAHPGLCIGIRGSGDYQRSLVYQGLQRTFLLHVPPAYPGTKHLPLVIVLHGGGGSGRKVARLTGFSSRADREGFVAVYPDGVNRHWNDGRNVGHYRAQRENVDDAGFISTLTDGLVRQLQLDSQRVYATGISNGGMMCYRLACDRSDKIAAIAPVCAAMAEELPDSSTPRKPVPVLAINGTRDPLVPWEGGGVGLLRKRGRVMSVRKTIDFWVKHNQCSQTPVKIRLPHKGPANGTGIEREVYGHGRDGSEVILYTVNRGGHTWPGGAERPLHFGRRSDDIDATEVIWEFFKRHTRRG